MKLHILDKLALKETNEDQEPLRLVITKDRKVISIIVLLAFVMMGSGCRLFHNHKKKHRGDGMVGDFSMPMPITEKSNNNDNNDNSGGGDGKPSDEYPAEKYVSYAVTDEKGA